MRMYLYCMYVYVCMYMYVCGLDGHHTWILNHRSSYLQQRISTAVAVLQCTWRCAMSRQLVQRLGIKRLMDKQVRDAGCPPVRGDLPLPPALNLCFLLLAWWFLARSLFFPLSLIYNNIYAASIIQRAFQQHNARNALGHARSHVMTFLTIHSHEYHCMQRHAATIIQAAFRQRCARNVLRNLQHSLRMARHAPADKTQTQPKHDAKNSGVGVSSARSGEVVRHGHVREEPGKTTQKPNSDGSSARSGLVARRDHGREDQGAASHGAPRHPRAREMADYEYEPARVQSSAMDVEQGRDACVFVCAWRGVDHDSRMFGLDL